MDEDRYEPLWAGAFVIHPKQEGAWEKGKISFLKLRFLIRNTVYPSDSGGKYTICRFDGRKSLEGQTPKDTAEEAVFSRSGYRISVDNEPICILERKDERKGDLKEPKPFQTYFFKGRVVKIRERGLYDDHKFLRLDEFIGQMPWYHRKAFARYCAGLLSDNS